MDPKRAAGEVEIRVGVKYRFRKLKDLQKSEIRPYLKWLANNAPEGSDLSKEIVRLKEAFEAYHGESLF